VTTPPTPPLPPAPPPATPGIIYSLPKQFVLVKFLRERIDQQKLLDELSKNQATLTAAKAAQAEKKKAIDALTAQIANTPDAGAKAELQKQLLLAEAEKKVADLVATNALAGVEEKLAQLRDFKPGDLRDTFTLEPQSAVPDLKKSYVAKLNHSRSRSDVVTLKTSAAGLLEGYVGTADDKTSQIVEASISAFKFATALSGGPKTVWKTYTPETVETPPAPFKYERTVDPLDLTALKTVSNDLRKKRAYYEVTLEGDTTHYSSGHATADGLYYRRPVYRTIAIYTATPTGSPIDYVQSLSLLLPNEGPIGRVDLPAARMVTTGYDFAFKEGMLISFNSTRPSEGLAAAMLIPNALKAIVAIPAEIIQLKVDYSSKEKALIDAKKANLDSELALLNSTNALNTANAAAESPPAP
jgi:hypothetical protein